jgi:hypothetical protein
MWHKVVWSLLATILVGIGGTTLFEIIPILTQTQALFITIIAFVLAGICLYKADLFDKKHPKTEQIVHNNEVKNNDKKYPDGCLENVSPEDRKLINKFGRDMILEYFHGHDDIDGMLADRANNVPLNELLDSPCSICRNGTLRNQRLKRRYKYEL